MPSCDVVPDSTDLGTNRPNLRPITVIGDRFEPIQIPSNVSWVNISTHTTVDVDQKNTKPRTSSWLKSALSMPINSLCTQMFRRRLNTLFIASSERLWQPGYRSNSGIWKTVSEARKNVNWVCNWTFYGTSRWSSNLQKKESWWLSWMQEDRTGSNA